MQWTRGCNSPNYNHDDAATTQPIHDDPALELGIRRSLDNDGNAGEFHGVDVDVELAMRRSVESQRTSPAPQRSPNLHGSIEPQRHSPAPSQMELLQRDNEVVDHFNDNSISIITIPGDGVCFFGAVQLYLNLDGGGVTHSHQALQERTIQWMYDNVDACQGFLFGETT